MISAGFKIFFSHKRTQTNIDAIFCSSLINRARQTTLLCALGRSLGIPTRVGFATVRNHLATKQMLERQGSDLFVYHGYTDFFLKGKWVKATPAFNKELCECHKVAPLEFNGLEFLSGRCCLNKSVFQEE